VNYVIAAWLSCAALLVFYSVRTVHRERVLRRSLSPKARLAPGRPVASPGPGRPGPAQESNKWT
jgi:hypothetical protein